MQHLQFANLATSGIALLRSVPSSQRDESIAFVLFKSSVLLSNGSVAAVFDCGQLIRNLNPWFLRI